MGKEFQMPIKFIYVLFFVFLHVGFALRSAYAIEISGPSFANVGDTVRFSIQNVHDTEIERITWYTGNRISNNQESIARSFSQPMRYAVRLVINQDSDNEQTLIHYINVGREIEDTIYVGSRNSVSSSANEVLNFSWLNCSSNRYNIYRGRYNQLYVQDNIAQNVPDENIYQALLFLDYMFVFFSETLGWDFIPTTQEALNTYVCDGVMGAGTGTGGTFIDPGFLEGASSNVLRVNNYGTLIHEYIHLWDFRSGYWQNSDETAHAFTASVEPIINHLMGTGQSMNPWFGDVKALPGEYLLHHYYRISAGRYLRNQSLSWNNYFGNPFINTPYNAQEIPQHKEKMLIQGAMQIALFKLFGEEAYREMMLSINESMYREDAFNTQFTQREISQNMMKAVSTGLNTDLTDFFGYWRFPVDELRDELSQLPPSQLHTDNDNDGYSRLEGDFYDDDSTRYPYAPELNDGVDNNLDGLIDEYVYEEGINDAFSTTVQLPALVMGELNSLSDIDRYRFELDTPTELTVVIYAKEGQDNIAYAPDSQRRSNNTHGTIRINGNIFTPLLHEAMITPGLMFTVTLGRGSNEISLDANASIFDINPNPGPYEMQIFVNEYRFTQTESDIFEYVYPSLPSSEQNKEVFVDSGQTVTLTAPDIGGFGKMVEWEQTTERDIEVAMVNQDSISFTMPELATDENIRFDVTITSTRGKVSATQTVSLNNSNQNSTPTTSNPAPVQAETASANSSGGVNSGLWSLLLFICVIFRRLTTHCSSSTALKCLHYSSRIEELRHFFHKINTKI